MELLIPLLASFLLLVGPPVLIATLGRRRRRRVATIEQRSVRAIEGVVGAELAELFAGAVRLRRLIEDTAAGGREMLTVESHLGGALRRPLWRQIEDANFGHALDRVRRDAAVWLASFDGLGAADRQVIELLTLDPGPVRELLEAEHLHWQEQGPPIESLRDRSEELASVQRQLSAAIDCLHRVERELSDYRPGGYR